MFPLSNIVLAHRLFVSPLKRYYLSVTFIWSLIVDINSFTRGFELGFEPKYIRHFSPLLAISCIIQTPRKLMFFLIKVLQERDKSERKVLMFNLYSFFSLLQI